MKANQFVKTNLFQMIVSSVIFVGTIALVVLLVSSRKSPDTQADLRKAPLVDFVPVQTFDGKMKINVTGVTMPFREITMAAEVTGAITEKSDACLAGTYVKKGTHLLSVDSERYGLVVNRLESEIKEANQRLRKAELELAAAEKILEKTLEDKQDEENEFAKRKKLEASGVLSSTEMIQSRRSLNAALNAAISQQSRVDTLKADVEAQKSMVNLKEIQKKEADIDYRKAIIQAPIDGVVISDDVEKDDFVQVGKQLLIFEDTSAVEVKCDLRADQLQAILEGEKGKSGQGNRYELPKKEARIEYSTNTDTYVWDGTLDRYDGLGLDERTRTAPCRILIKDTLSKDGKRTLFRGMYVSVELNVGKRPGLLKIPAEALRAGNMVWVFEDLSADDKTDGAADGQSESVENTKAEVLAEDEEMGRLKKLSVEVVSRIETEEGEFVIAREKKGTFQPGDRLVISPVPQPVDGMKLRHKRSAAVKPPTDDSGTASSQPPKTAIDSPQVQVAVSAETQLNSTGQIKVKGSVQ